MLYIYIMRMEMLRCDSPYIVGYGIWMGYRDAFIFIYAKIFISPI